MSTLADLLADLDRTRDETLRHFDRAPADLDRTYGPQKWSVRFVLHHLADTETVLFDRVRRVLSAPRPVIWAFDQDAWADHLDYAGRPMELSKQLFASARAGVRHYAEQHYDGSEALEFVHSVTGVKTLHDVFDKIARHNQRHLDQIAQALDG